MIFEKIKRYFNYRRKLKQNFGKIWKNSEVIPRLSKYLSNILGMPVKFSEYV